MNFSGLEVSSPEYRPHAASAERAFEFVGANFFHGREKRRNMRAPIVDSEDGRLYCPLSRCV